MKSRTAAALLAGLGLTTGGAMLTMGPAFAGSDIAVVETTTPTTPDDGSATATTDTTAAEDDGAADDTADAAQPAANAWLTDAVQALVDDGTLTQEQADAVVAALADARPAPGERLRAAAAASLEVLTEALGVTAEELQTAFADGQSIADVAAAQGVDVQTVIDALVASATERIDAALADGTITEAQATERTAALTEHVTELVNRAGGPQVGQGGNRPGGPMGPGMPGGHGNGGGGPMGPGGEAPGQPPADDGTATTDTAAATTDTTATT